MYVWLQAPRTTATPEVLEVAGAKKPLLVKKPIITVFKSNPVKPAKPSKGMYKQFADKFSAKASGETLTLDTIVLSSAVSEKNTTHGLSVNHNLQRISHTCKSWCYFLLVNNIN